MPGGPVLPAAQDLVVVAPWLVAANDEGLNVFRLADTGLDGALAALSEDGRTVELFAIEESVTTE